MKEVHFIDKNQEMEEKSLSGHIKSNYGKVKNFSGR